MAQARIYATGKRKTAVARVYIKAGSGRITVNGREFEEYFPVLALRAVATQSLVLVGKRTSIDVDVNIGGGGPYVPGRVGQIRNREGAADRKPRAADAVEARGVPDPRRADQGAEKVRPAGGAETVPVLQAVKPRKGRRRPESNDLPKGKAGQPAFLFFLSGG